MGKFQVIGLVLSVVLLSLLYFTILVLIILKRKNPLIIRRSPKILLVSLIGGYFQNMFYFSWLFQLEELFPSQYSNECFISYQIRQSLFLISHFLIYYPYILRAYRLYLIYQLDSNLDLKKSFFDKAVTRVKEKWLLKTLGILMVPIIIIGILTLSSCDLARIMPGLHSEGTNDYTKSVYLYMSFFEEIVIIFFIYKLRNLHDHYDMSKELTWAMIILLLTNVFAVFPFDIGPLAWLPVVCKNMIMLGISFIYILCKSFMKSREAEVFTLEMLESLELVLQNQTSLACFEKFLAENELINGTSSITSKGSEILQLFMKCENYLSNPDRGCMDQLVQDVLNSDCLPIFYINSQKESFEKYIEDVKTQLFKLLKNDFYPKFLQSPRCQNLQKHLFNREIYIGILLEAGINISFMKTPKL